MDTSAARRFRIVVGLDLSEYSEIVLEHAIDQAARHEKPELHFITVIERGMAPDIEEAKARLADLVLPLLGDLSKVDWRARLHVRRGHVEEEIANLAAELRADLVVVGRFGLHGRRAGGKLGRVASRVLALATCPTLVVGMVDDSSESVPGCPDCVAVRKDSDGEQWFCERHRADRASLASVYVPGPIWTGGGLLW